MIVMYNKIAWYGKNLDRLFIINLTIDNINYGNVIVNPEENIFGKMVLEYCKENNIEITEKVATQDESYYADLEDDMIKRAITNAVQNQLDSLAKQRNYDSVESCITYYNSSDSVFANEAKAMLDYRDKCWRTCYNLLDQYTSGEIVRPTPVDVLNALPVLEW